MTRIAESAEALALRYPDGADEFVTTARTVFVSARVDAIFARTIPRSSVTSSG